MSSNGGFVDAFSPATTSTANTTDSRSSSAVRSRTRRLISSNNDDDNTSADNGAQRLSSSLFNPDVSAARSRGTTPSPYSSRGASPLPMRHPSRATESPNNRAWGNNHGASGTDRLKPTESSRAGVDFLDASWSSLQSLASSVLGSDMARPVSNGSARTHVRKPSRPDPNVRNIPKSTPSAWGPSAPNTPEIGAGTQEERQAYVQAKKREALLLADTRTPTGRDTRHKRRDSSDQTGYGSIDPDEDEDALAYVHHVQPTDSITGVTIKYGCQAAIFRKANGFWPSDSIQSRKTVLLPVDACSVKGRPIRSADALDLLSNEAPPRNSLEDLNGSSIAPAPVPDREERSTGTTSEAEGDNPWRHESWVQIDGFSAAVEIGRVPRRALGFFPRSRRKSVSLSYVESEQSSISGRDSTTAAALATPSSSSPPGEQQSTSQYFDSPRSQPHAGSSGSSTGPAANARPGGRHQRQRSGFQFSGPGVGTLDRSTMTPGPALDGLSKFFAQHLPNLSMQPSAPNFQPSSETNAASNASTGLENIGGAFEGWVRKVATRAKASLNDLQQPATQSHQINSRGPVSRGRRMGDLIELDDGIETRSSSAGLLSDPRQNPNSNLTPEPRPSGSTSVRERFPSPSSASVTSRTRGGGQRSSAYCEDRFKDD